MITRDEFCRYFNNFSPVFLFQKVRVQVRRIHSLIVKAKGLKTQQVKNKRPQQETKNKNKKGCWKSGLRTLNTKPVLSPKLQHFCSLSFCPQPGV